MKHRFKSIDGAVRRIRQLERALGLANMLLDVMKDERVVLAKLGADEPMFNSPLEVWEAKIIRDRVLKEVGE